MVLSVGCCVLCDMWSLFVVCWVLPVARPLLLVVVGCLLCVVCCCCLMYVACCLLCDVRLLVLFVVCGLRCAAVICGVLMCVVGNCLLLFCVVAVF